MHQLGSFSIYVVLAIIIFIFFVVCIFNTILIYDDYNSNNPELSDSNSSYLIVFNILLAILFFIIFIMLIYMSRTDMDGYNKIQLLEKEKEKLIQKYSEMPDVDIDKITEVNTRINEIKDKPNPTPKETEFLKKEIEYLKSINAETLKELQVVTDINSKIDQIKSEKEKEAEDLKKKLLLMAEEHKDIIEELKKELEKPVEPIKQIEDIQKIEEKLIAPTNIEPVKAIEKEKPKSVTFKDDLKRSLSDSESSSDSDTESEDDKKMDNNRFRSFLNYFKKN